MDTLARRVVASVPAIGIGVLLGAGLPLLLLFALGGQSPLVVLNGELVAVEVIRALVGSIGIVAAVPLTTLVAALLMVPSEPMASGAA